MAKKMYYNEEEAAEQLGISPEELAVHVKGNKLRVFQDGSKRMYLAQEVDKLANELTGAEIELTPADTGGDVVSLEEADEDNASLSDTGKEDTVITAEGISIFDDEDLEIEAADPMAKTQIAPSLEDQVSVEGVGSGSGLLDLTRESDDTSLGAEVLDNIDVEGVNAEIVEDEPEPAYPTAAPAVAYSQPVEQVDASSGLFGGLAVGAMIAALLAMAIAVPVMQGAVPGFVRSLKQNMPAVCGGLLVVAILGAVVGYFLGKSAADRRAMR
jgi:hypothetical protein